MHVEYEGSTAVTKVEAHVDMFSSDSCCHTQCFKYRIIETTESVFFTSAADENEGLLGLSVGKLT